MPINITQDNFETEIIKSSTPIVIDIYATWCGPCQFMTPILEELEEEYNGKYKFAKINVDEARELAIKFSVSSVPTFIFMKNGQVMGKETGQMSKEELQTKIDELLG
ncbi:MAG TPA: thioredoxin [Candidatus Babeliales bacterium]|nr:thioredoxin [Candidatus Babeliales bacterium]